jgi:excisionase family DNA binding protein
VIVRLHEIDAAAKRLHVTVYTLRKYVREGRISHARIGGRLLFSEEHLAEFVRSQTTPVRQTEAVAQ